MTCGAAQPSDNVWRVRRASAVACHLLDGLLSLPAPRKQTQRTEASREKW